MMPPLLPRIAAIVALTAAVLPLGPALADEACLPDGSGRLDMIVSGAVEARIAWGDGMECQGMPRPDGSGLRLMFANREEGLLIVLGIAGATREETGRNLPANITLVREGRGEFFSTLGDDVCRVSILEASPVEGPGSDVFRVRGEGSCPDPVPAVGREGAVEIRPFAFTGVAVWPPAGER